MSLANLRVRVCTFVFSTAMIVPASFAQSLPATIAALPDAPPASTDSVHVQQLSSSSKPDLAGKQTSRILGIIPNFRSVSVDEHLPPQSVRAKFKETTEDSFDYSDFIFVGVLAGVSQAENSSPEFQQGAAGFGRYYWHTLADQVDENYQVEFVLPVLLHQDARYYTLGRGGLLKRSAYALSRIFITRTDSRGESFNASEIIGAGGASGISDLYYPSSERTWTKTGQRWVLNVGLDGATFVLKEFWPDLNNAFFHQTN